MNFLDKFKSDDPNRWMNPQGATALMGIGHGLSALGNGQTPNLMPYANKIQGYNEAGGLQFSAKEVEALMNTTPEAAHRMILEKMRGGGQIANAARGVTSGPKKEYPQGILSLLLGAQK